MSRMRSAVDWLRPVWPAVPELDTRDRERLERLDALLAERMPADPLRTGDGDRSAWLLRLRTELAVEGYAALTLPTRVGGQGRPLVLQALAQFVCGFHDLDLRDATGAGHGALLCGLPESPERRRWWERLAAGELVGIAATERHGGSRLREITTRADRGDRHTWILNGEKTWVSRLAEASAFVVFVRGPLRSGRHEVSAVLVDAGSAGLQRAPEEPAGLAGWSWGVLRFEDVEIDVREHIVGRPGAGVREFERHLDRYRPLVAATALGAAAGVHSAVSRTVGGRHRAGVTPRVRDNVLVSLGRTYEEVVAHLLQAVAATRLAAAGHAAGPLWARSGKAGGVDAACRVVDELLPLGGAAGFRRSSRLVKVRGDLAGYGFADGVHDALHRSAGKHLLRPDPSRGEDRGEAIRPGIARRPEARGQRQAAVSKSPRTRGAR